MTKNIHKHRILTLDLGPQYIQLVARHVHELDVCCELWAQDVTETQTRDFSPSGIAFSGGPESTAGENSPRAPQYVFEAGVPIFGVYCGMQTTVMQLSGHIEASNEHEFGHAQAEAVNDSALIRGIEDALTADGKPLLDVWMSCGDKVTATPSDFVTIASAESYLLAIMANEEKCFYGIQFHPKATHTRQGMCILGRLVHDICRHEALWTPVKIIDDAVTCIREQVGDDKVTLGSFGGMDSSVTVMLLHRTIGKNLTCAFVDNGLLRLNEAEQVLDTSGDHFGLNVVHVSAEDRPLSALAGENDPEAKHKIIGRVFVEAFDKEALKLEDVKWLVQDIIYLSVIVSVASTTGKAHVIKSHHSVGGLPEETKMSLVEPLKELFKGEVCKIGLESGLLYDMLYRHLLPGPGLGVCVLGEVKKEYRGLLHRADAIFIEELRKADLYGKISQALAVFPPVRSVDVVGDGRKCDWVVPPHAVETIDFMTAHWTRLPYDLLGRVSNRIINEVNGIPRVVYDISGKPPATIEWE